MEPISSGANLECSECGYALEPDDLSDTSEKPSSRWPPDASDSPLYSSSFFRQGKEDHWSEKAGEETEKRGDQNDSDSKKLLFTGRNILIILICLGILMFTFRDVLEKQISVFLFDGPDQVIERSVPLDPVREETEQKEEDRIWDREDKDQSYKQQIRVRWKTYRDKAKQFMDHVPVHTIDNIDSLLKKHRDEGGRVLRQLRNLKEYHQFEKNKKVRSLYKTFRDWFSRRDSLLSRFQEDLKEVRTHISQNEFKQARRYVNDSRSTYREQERGRSVEQLMELINRGEKKYYEKKEKKISALLEEKKYPEARDLIDHVRSKLTDPGLIFEVESYLDEIPGTRGFED